MSHLGTLINSNTIRFARLLPAPIELAWEYLTKPHFLASWLAEADVDLRVGGRVELRFDEADDPVGVCKGENISGGLISACEAPHRLTFEFSAAPAGKTILTFDLRDSADQTLLVLTHSNLPPDLMVAVAAGWHSYLEVLVARLSGEEPQPFVPLFRAMVERYTFVVASAGIVLSASPAVAAQDPQVSQELQAVRGTLLSKYDRQCKEEDELQREIDALKRSSSPDVEKTLDYLDQRLKDKQRDVHKLELDIGDIDKALI